MHTLNLKAEAIPKDAYSGFAVVEVALRK